MDDLLDALLSPHKKKKLVCKIDIMTHVSGHNVKRYYGGYKPFKPREVTICDSLCINKTEKVFDDMVNDMVNLSLNRSKLLNAEKRSSKYERMMKEKKKK